MDEVVRGLVGTPFVSGGRDPRTGLDCWGLVMEVYKRCGVRLPDFAVDPTAFRVIDTLVGNAAGKMPWVDVFNPCDGDAPLVVLMRLHPLYINHAGVMMGGGRIIHTMATTNAVITRVEALRKIIVGYYRYVDNHNHT